MRHRLPSTSEEGSQCLRQFGNIDRLCQMTVHASCKSLLLKMYVKLDVADTGKGISESKQASIFRRFYREEEVHDEPGVGIGLYLAREIITRQGGYIRVSSEKALRLSAVGIPLGLALRWLLGMALSPAILSRTSLGSKSSVHSASPLILLAGGALFPPPVAALLCAFSASGRAVLTRHFHLNSN